MRPVAEAFTRFGENSVRIAFYPDEHSHMCKGFSMENHMVTAGHTLCILYAERKKFLDGSVGVRVERLEYCYIFRAPLNIVMREAKHILSNADGDAVDGPVHCAHCGKAETAGHRLERCSKCHLAFYCSRECQVSAWRDGHKLLCGDADKLLRLSCLPRHKDV